MCYGSVTQLRCSHPLIHFQTRCGNGCELPHGPRYYLDDTCALCEPAHKIQRINTRYEMVAAELKDNIRKAAKQGRREEEGALKARLNQLPYERFLEVQKANRVKPASQVLWPGKGEDE